MQTVRKAGSHCCLICQINSEVFSSVYWRKISVFPTTVVTGKTQTTEENHVRNSLWKSFGNCWIVHPDICPGMKKVFPGETTYPKSCSVISCDW